MDKKMNRLDKVVCSICDLSRSDAKKSIYKGLVSVNGETIKTPDYKADFNGAVISVNGRGFTYSDNLYIIMNKPKNYVCTNLDDELSVLHLIPENMFRKNLFTVGRLDKDTTGLLIITNDGDFAHKVISPKKNIAKTYYAKLSDELCENELNVLKNGVTLNDGDFVKAAEIKYLQNSKKDVLISITSGKYHQVKRMFGAVNNSVIELSRKSIGSLELPTDLALGECRILNEKERELLFVQN